MTPHWDGPLSPAAKLALFREVLATYVRARVVMRSQQIVYATERMRDERRRIEPVPAAERRAAGIHLASAVNRVLHRLPLDSRCLARSLVLTAMLDRRSIPTVLVLGVRTTPSFAAHAWVELDGRPLLAPGDTRMKRLYEV